jgi:hypothetical protein
MSPVFMIFLIVHMLTFLQYLINKRIDSLKDATWGILDTKQEKSLEKLTKKLKNLKNKNKSEKRKSIKSRTAEDLLSPNLDLFSPKSDNSLDHLDLKLINQKATVSDLSLMSPRTEISSKSPNSPKELFSQSSTSPKELFLEKGANSDFLAPNIHVIDNGLDLKENLSKSDGDLKSNTISMQESTYSSDHTLSMEIDDEDMKELKKIFKILKIAKFFGSFWFKIFIIVVCYFIIMLTHVAIHGGIQIFRKNNCTLDSFPLSNAISSLITPFYLFIFLFFIIALSTVDIILFIKENGCKLKSYFLYDDPFGFRIEQFFVIFFIIILIWFPFLPLGVYFLNQREQDPVDSLKGEISGIIQSMFLIGFEFILIMIFCTVGLILSIISFIKRKLEPKIYDSEFDAFINTKKGKEIFKEFAKKEWSTENIQFFEQVEKYKKIWHSKFAEKRAKEIVQNYVEAGSPLEVNLSGEVRKTTKYKVNNFKEFKDGYKIIFDDAIKETKRNMRDTFARIRKTSEFEDWKTSSKVLIE